jgi:3-oxoacyl-[acyl-carrier-protein] synthase-1
MSIVSVLSCGAVTSVGLNAEATCAAIRCGLTNPTTTRFMDSSGEWLIAYEAPLSAARGHSKVMAMCVQALRECLAKVPRQDWNSIPVFVCLAESTRAGGATHAPTEFLADLQRAVECKFSADSAVIAGGRVGVAMALQSARQLLDQNRARHAVIVGTDSLVEWQTLRALVEQGRLCTNRNSNGFIAGQAACAVLVGLYDAAAAAHVEGIGFGDEPAPIDSEIPSRAEGLTVAIRAAFLDAGVTTFEPDFRISGLSGEQFFFKEAAVAASRALKYRREQLELWHPADCVGEVGAAVGPLLLAVAHSAYAKGYAVGPRALLHLSNDGSERAAILVRQGTAHGE